MSPHMSPPGTTEDVRAKSVLVLAPHYDDEVLGCGGLIRGLADGGAVVRVLFLSESGAESPPDEDRASYSSRRRDEARAATGELGISGRDHLGLPDGALSSHVPELSRGIERALLSQRPDLLLVPSPLEVSRDHRAAFHAVHRLLGGLRGKDPLLPLVRDLQILAYEVNRPFDPDVLVDVSQHVEAIERAMGCYASQQERHDYLGARLGLLRFRAWTLPPEVRAAEGYRRLSFADFETSGVARLLGELGGRPLVLEAQDGPKISVIVRTKDRPELLAEALTSLAASTYRQAEVIVVNDGGAEVTTPPEFPLPLRVVDLESNRGRAAAANEGLSAASGDYVSFLDDDDLVEPEHLATLAGLVQAAGVRIAYTDAAVGLYELDPEAGWRCVERRLPYSRDFDPDLLLFDNYIPFNTLVIDRDLIAEAGPLDDSLAFFEDWDFLIRLAALAPFQHLARVTCEYRHFRGAAHHILGDRPRRDDFLEMKARVIQKHSERWSADTVARAVDLLRSENVADGEEIARLRDHQKGRELALEEAEERYHDLNGRFAGLEVHQKVLEASERRARELFAQREKEVVELQQRVRELEGHVGALEQQARESDATQRQTWDEIERLNQLVKTMEASKAWRIHQWVQGIKS